MPTLRRSSKTTVLLLALIACASSLARYRRGENLVQCRLEHLCGLDAMGLRRPKRDPEEVGR